MGRNARTVPEFLRDIDRRLRVDRRLLILAKGRGMRQRCSMKNPPRFKRSVRTGIGIAVMACCVLGCTKDQGVAPAPKPSATAAANPSESAPESGVSPGCNLGPCHGLDVTCTAGAPLMCAQIYTPGDFCRQFVKCAQVEGTCALRADARFAQCKACMEGCQAKADCDATCRSQLGVR